MKQSLRTLAAGAAALVLSSIPARADVAASNGVIHVIDAVLMPKK